MSGQGHEILLAHSHFLQGTLKGFSKLAGALLCTPLWDERSTHSTSILCLQTAILLRPMRR